ncbi:3-deoxy-7-phosphoheptulonate synthase [Saccharothrix syringae]|uniref:Phospho-2-dehydro-3-deoxyheptonate aldolase n=1 Tax=Saccharothrix syringae TaxID=103733 RepID=A0A5Q0GZI6_SACSY|nr:3-deoxy-7-phosphoheptulonate synthase [Saccharothrix syringae]QFZ19446.1 phospho-2-dehydro-3-deoxyheptonate aldolase [Saccharothrix syringae]
MSIEIIARGSGPVWSAPVGPAAQQPPWPGHRARRFRERLAALPGLVTADEVDGLRSALAEVAAGGRLVLQAGDCAEPFAECTPHHLARKAALLDRLARALGRGRPVARVGRIAGQFAKPRSRPTEVVDGVELPVYRGDLVNAPQADARARRADPARLVAGYHAARAATEFLRGGGPWTWTSHEALVLDYELPLVRRDERGRVFLASTHWPWIGDRTRDLGGAHVELLASVANPVACKVGPGMRPDELVALCERLDPDRVPGRLALIARLGAERVSALLPPLVAAVRAAGHPVIWLCDPLHGNTVVDADGHKTRFVDAVAREVVDFRAAVRSAGAVAGGLHLETSPEQVGECRWNGSATRSGPRTTLCDPRLNPWQALAVVAAWHAADF